MKPHHLRLDLRAPISRRGLLLASAGMALNAAEQPKPAPSTAAKAPASMSQSGATTKPAANPNSALAAKLAADYQRPKCHLMPPANWMNDPNGPIYWRGQYHMFYQYNPKAPVWGPMHWGHAVSPDMVHWHHLPVAFAPSRNGPDHKGVWSGCIVDNGGTATAIYTGVEPQVQCMATSRDLSRWTKRPEPVLAGPPEGLQALGFRDPWVWHENDIWYMALGCGVAGVGGMILLYSSPDLLNWTYIHPLYQGKMDPNVQSSAKDAVGTGEMFECPAFFPLGDKYVLFVSTRGTTPYWIGTYKDQTFTPESEGRLDYGSYYAANSQLDERGRRIIWGWVQERRSVQAQRQAGWSGVMSFPREVKLTNGKLEFTGAPQLRSLRDNRRQLVNLAIPDRRAAPVPGVSGDALEIFADFEQTEADEYGLRVLCSPDLTEGTPIVYNRREQRLSVGTAHPSWNNNLTLAANEPLRLHVYVDCSVIEVIANNRVCLTERSYTPRPDYTGVALYSRGGTPRVRSLVAYDLKPISDDRLTT